MLYVGLDVHTKHIALCVLSQTGQVVQRARVRGIEEMRRLLQDLPDRFEVCYEASCGYGHYHDVLQPLATRVLVAHPGRLRLIFRSTNKNDRNDSTSAAAGWRSPSPKVESDLPGGQLLPDAPRAVAARRGRFRLTDHDVERLGHLPGGRLHPLADPLVRAVVRGQVDQRDLEQHRPPVRRRGVHGRLVRGQGRQRPQPPLEGVGQLGHPARGLGPVPAGSKCCIPGRPAPPCS